MVFPSIPGPVMTLLLASLPYLIYEYSVLQQTTDYTANILPITAPNDDQVYDFIVVGGGSGGAVVANRLSAPPKNYKVLLLEAGGDPNWVTYIPGTDFFCPNQSSIDWMYQAKPQQDCCLALNNERIPCHRGLSLGGSSAINFMVYLRGNQAGFDEWANITGDSSWNAQNVLKYFKKSENYQGNYPNAEYHATDGPLYVDKMTYHPSLDVFMDAITELGYTEQDVNVNQTNAWMKMDATINTGVRWSTYSAFLEPVLERPNLQINRYSKVVKLIFDPANSKRIIGVKYLRQNNTIPKYAFVSKEVILSAGAFNSPQLLMLSGIGPSQDLQTLKIPVRVNNSNIGTNLQDHVTTYIPILFNTTRTSMILERDEVPDSLNLYDSDRSGPLAANNLMSTGYFSSPANNDPTWPDVQYLVSYAGISEAAMNPLQLLTNFKTGTVDKYLEPYFPTDGNFPLVIQVKPKSVGTVKLASSSPNDVPLIDLNYFSDPDNFDMQSMIHGVKNIINIYENSTAYKKYNATLVPAPFPGCETEEFRSDAYYECFVRQFTSTVWHFSGTCRMGKSTDPLAVVDPTLKLIGLSNLRVIDASIMPKVTNGNTNAPTIMIGEKGSDIILNTWINSSSSTTPINPVKLALIKGEKVTLDTVGKYPTGVKYSYATC